LIPAKERLVRNKTIAVASVVFLLAVMAIPASAQGPSHIIWSSAYQIQNLEGDDATVHIAYYDQDSSSVYEGDVTVQGSSSKTIFPFTSGGYGDEIVGPGTFNGSAVLSSDKQIAAILNTQTGAGSSSFYGAATKGFSEGAMEMSLPLIACNNGGFDTWFNIQNVGDEDADVTVEYVPGLYGLSGLSDNFTVEPFRAKTLDQRAASTTGTKDCDDLADGSGRFVGSANITSDEPIVATAMFLGTGSYKTVQGYNGFTPEAESANLPLIMANNSTYYTSIQIQNAGDSDADVVVTYSENTVGVNDPAAETYTIAAGASQTIIHVGTAFSQVDWDAIGQYVGAATITQDGTTEPLVAVVNQNSTLYTSLGSTYEGMSPDEATDIVSLPLVAANNGGFLTGIQVQAINDDTDVTITYYENTAEPGEIPDPDTFTLDAGESKTLIQYGPPGTLSGVNDWDDIGQYIGAADVTADGPILAIVNFNGPPTGDTFYTYDGFNQ
jgi:hypothetical protein